MHSKHIPSRLQRHHWYATKHWPCPKCELNDKQFPLTIPSHFPDRYQIARHFRVFQTNGHRASKEKFHENRYRELAVSHNLHQHLFIRGRTSMYEEDRLHLKIILLLLLSLLLRTRKILFDYFRNSMQCICWFCMPFSALNSESSDGPAARYIITIFTVHRTCLLWIINVLLHTAYCLTKTRLEEPECWLMLINK